MELAGHKERMLRDFQHFHEFAVRGDRRDLHAGLLKFFRQLFSVEHGVALTVPFGDLFDFVELIGLGAGLHYEISGAQLRLPRPLLVDDADGGPFLALVGKRGVLDLQHVLGELDGGAFHAGADAEIGNFVFPGVFGGQALALLTVIGHAAHDQDAVHAGESLLGVLDEILGLHDLCDDLGVALHAGVLQRFIDALVSVFYDAVAAHKRHGAAIFGLGGFPDQGVPVGVLDGVDGQIELLQDFLVKVLPTEFPGNGVNAGGDVAFLDDSFGTDVAEERQLVPVLLRELHFRPADQNVRDNADGAEHRHGLLTGLGLQFLGGPEERDQRQMHEAGVVGAFLETELTGGFQKGLGLDVAGDAAYFAKHDVDVRPRGASDGRFDLVGDMGNDLDGAAQVSAFPLSLENGGVDLAAGIAGALGAGDAREALIVAQVQVSFRAVVGQKDLAVLEGAHDAGINVQVRIELLHEDTVPAAF